MARRWRASVKNREALAIRADIDILELLCDAPPPNEIRGEVGILFVRGPIDHHASFGDSYERITSAFHELNDNSEVKAIAMIVDSPGGLVSGLNATVRALRKAKAKPVYAIADEMATSAAYAISCLADEIIATPSAVVGSIGVISTMASQARADARQGFDFVTITSGERKADGHPHMPIERGAIEAEEKRVDELAAQFYTLVDDARGLSPDYLRALEAGIFLGPEALDLGLVDEVMDVDDALEAIAMAHGLAQSGTNSLALQNGSGRGVIYDPPSEAPPMLSAKAAIANMTRKMAASTSKPERAALAKKINALLAKLPAASTTKKSYRLEEEKTETSDEEDEEEAGNETDREEEGEDEDEKKAVSEEEEEEASARSADDKEDEKKAESDDDKDGDFPEKKEKKSARAAGRVAALEAEVTSLRSVVAAIQSREARDMRESTLAEALRQKRISPAERATLAKKPKHFIEAFLEARPRSIVLTPEEALRPLPKGSAHVARASGGVPEASAELTPEQEQMLASVGDEKLRAQILSNWTAKVNGASR